ncbi:MAG: response regulator [Polyangiales bacterium]
MESAQPTVLVIDDDRDGCALLAEWLQTRGYAVIEAWDGLDGLELLHLKRRRIAAVILDLEMPNIDGVSFRQQQLHYPALRGVPVIVSSGHARAEEIGRGLNAFAVVPKPISHALLEDALTRALAQGAP